MRELGGRIAAIETHRDGTPACGNYGQFTRAHRRGAIETRKSETRPRYTALEFGGSIAEVRLKRECVSVGSM